MRKLPSPNGEIFEASILAKITTIHNGLRRFDDRGGDGVASYGNLRYYSARWRDYESRFLHPLALAWNEPDRYARTMFYMALDG